MEFLNQESVIRLNPKGRAQDCQAGDGRKKNFPKGGTECKLPKDPNCFVSFCCLFYLLMQPLSLATYSPTESYLFDKHTRAQRHDGGGTKLVACAVGRETGDETALRMDGWVTWCSPEPTTKAGVGVSQQGETTEDPESRDMVNCAL